MSRLNAKIKRKQLVSQKRDEFWEELWTQVKNTRDTLNTHYFAQITATRNDHNTTIRAGLPLDSIKGVKPSLEIIFERDNNTIMTRFSNNPDTLQWEKAVTYQIKANIDNDTLVFESNKKQYTPVELAETLLAENLLKLNLDAD